MSGAAPASGLRVAGLQADIEVDERGVALELAVEPGETLAVAGPSGAGKSTLVEAVAGLVRPTRGRIRIGSRVVFDTGGARTVDTALHRRGAVLLGQDPHVFPHLTARQNVAFGLRAPRAASRAATHAVDDLLERVGLGALADARPGTLSGGQRQRVALARALASRPDVLLLDEPFTALDPETADGMREVVAAACVGVTCVLVTHNAVDAAALATRIAVIEDGRRTQSGPVREVLQAPATPFAASFAGVNRLVGRAAGGRWIGDGLRVAGAEAAGVADGARLIAVFAPSAMRLTRLPPDGSGTNGSDGVDAAGVCTVTRVQGTPSGARVHLDAPGLFADVPLAEVAQGDLRPGVRVAVRIDARAVSLLPG